MKPRSTSKRRASEPSVRWVALQVVHGVISNRGSLATLLPQWGDKVAVQDRALLRELSYGVARWSLRLSALLTKLMDKPLRNKDQDVASLLQIGLYQLAYMRIPEHAAINATVSVATEMRKPWAKALVNAVLRNYLRQREELEAGVSGCAAQACPAWLAEQINKDWPANAQSILAFSTARPPMILRVNLSTQTREAYLQLLAEAGVAATAGNYSASAVVLDEPLAVEKLPGFRTGKVSVQDTAAQLAATLLDPQPQQRILDACAAPGGKTCHLLEYAAAASVTAVDTVDSRLQRVTENADRIGVANRVLCICADAADLDSWWDGEQFDAVLLDAPCSGTGVLRRHPDIKLLRRPEDIPALVELQQKLLDRLWVTVKPGGKLLYATCSVLKVENEYQVKRFLQKTTDAALVPIAGAAWGEDTEYGRQILPLSVDADGFFYSLMVKAA